MNKIPDSALVVLRDGLFPRCSTEALQFALETLEADDKRWLQGATTSPPPLQCMVDHAVEGACLFGLCGWGEITDDATVGQVEERFARLCYEVDQKMGEPAAVRYFLNWHDEAPREEVRLTLIQELDAEIKKRQNPG